MRATEISREHVSGLFFWLGVSLIVGLGTNQLLKDGSFWMDEAAVAMSFLKMEPSEFIGQLRGGQNFPRLYLILIAQLEGLFGYQTMVVRFLPYVFFVAGTVLWLRLLRLRFGAVPLLLCLAIVLSLVPTSWVWYSAMLKQYTFDVFVALVPFSLSDAYFEESLRKGRRIWRPFLLTLFCAMSYTYALALLARVVGWYFGGFGAAGAGGLRQGMREGRHRLSARAVLVFVGGVLLFSLSLWFTDLRHTAEQDFVFEFWKQCILARAWDDWGQVLALLDRFALGWYWGATDFGSAHLPFIPMTILRIAFCLGVLRIAWSLFDRRAPTSPELEKWGTRSVGCLFCAGGLLAASALVEYPICAGRLTLFVAFGLQIVLLEGLSLVDTALRRFRLGAVVSTALLVVMIGLVLPTAHRSTARVIHSDPPENIRPLARRMRERGDLPVLVLPCARKQATTLPEGFGDARVEYLAFWDSFELVAPAGGAAWVLDVPSKWKFCRASTWRMEDLSTSFEPFHTERDTARLYLAHFPEDEVEEMPEPPPEPSEATATGP